MEHDELRLIYEKYYKTLFLYALSLCGNQQDAEDLVHTTFLKAFLSYQSTGSIRYWLSKVLKNEFLNFQKQRARIAEESSLKLEQLSEESRILDKIILDEQKRRLFQAIMHLPLIQKNVLMDTIYFNLKDEEIANINNISRENVRQIRSRAKKKNYGNDKGGICMNDFDKLEHELKSMGELQIETPDMNREIEKMINKRIRNICLKTIGAVAIVLALIFVCISPVMKSIYLNPVKIEKDNNSFTNYLRTYYETIQPYVEIGQTQIKDKGFGNYDIGIDANEFTGANGISINASKNPEIIMEFKQNKGMITLDSTRALGYTVDRFKCYWNEKNKILEEIKKLPSSSYITMSLGTTQVRSVTELMKEDIHPEWVEIYNPESKFQGGLNLNFKIMKKDTDERNHMTEQELSNVFKDNLELLLSKPKLLQSLGINSFYTLDEIQETRNIFENKNSLTTKNYCISGTKEQIINYLEKTETVSIYVDNIKLSTLGI